MKKVILKRIIHRNCGRFAIMFPYDTGLTILTREIAGVAYSNTHKCWYVDDSEEKLREILRVFRGNADVDISAIASSIPSPAPIEPDPEEEGQRTVISIDPDQDFQEEVPERPWPLRRSGFDPVEFRISEESGRLVIRFTGRYDRSWIDELKAYGKVFYDKRHREFLIAWSKITVDSLSDYFSGKGIPVKIIRPRVGPDVREIRKSFSNEVRSRPICGESIEAVELLRRHLQEIRYSPRTVEAYIALLELFFRYFSTKTPEVITQDEVSDFFSDFIIKNGFSQSYQNQMVSAIKMYYEISGKGRIIPQFLERPRRGRALPKVFSKDEVTRILNSSGNIKHKLLLWMIYSCGLRRSEVTNIHLLDIDRKRNIIHIREGKGGVDRIVPVPDRLWVKLDEYIESYNPHDYLFEGQSGRRYSGESVYNVFRQALKKAGINKEVGVHSLRHSYATHLHESGLDIRYIQELLGHKSTRTTEIYTHVSRRNLVTVRSPIEDLDVR